MYTGLVVYIVKFPSLPPRRGCSYVRPRRSQASSRLLPVVGGVVLSCLVSLPNCRTRDVTDRKDGSWSSRHPYCPHHHLPPALSYHMADRHHQGPLAVPALSRRRSVLVRPSLLELQHRRRGLPAVLLARPLPQWLQRRARMLHHRQDPDGRGFCFCRQWRDCRMVCAKVSQLTYYYDYTSFLHSFIHRREQR